MSEVLLDRFTGMTIFVKVVDAGSFAAAARHFGISAAMVSKHVQTLEEHLGARLLNRTTRRVSATEVGEHFYEPACAFSLKWKRRNAPPAICKQHREAS
jgi:DNA-binding transcriptional LysR family regulator